MEIFWGVAGHGEIILGDTTYDFGTGNVLWKLPEETHAYRSGLEGMELRWFTFDGPQAETFLAGYGYPRRISEAGLCPFHLFDAIESGLREMTSFSQRHLISVAAEILALAGRRHDTASSGGRIVSRFIELAQTNFGNASVNVNTIADLIGVHRSTLSRHFLEQMLVSPGEYLNRLRLQHALTLLQESELPINEVAELAGIPDRSYFCRFIRRTFGVSPRQLREQAIRRSR